MKHLRLTSTLLIAASMILSTKTTNASEIQVDPSKQKIVKLMSGDVAPYNVVGVPFDDYRRMHAATDKIPVLEKALKELSSKECPSCADPVTWGALGGAAGIVIGVLAYSLVDKR